MPAGICWVIPKERNYIEDIEIEKGQKIMTQYGPVEVFLGGALKLQQTSSST
jgi:hypothetical protein